MTQNNTKIEEQIEGLEENQTGSWGDYPIDTLLIRNESRTVQDVLRRIDAKRFIMNPEFQRDFIWKEDKQSRLIESVVMRIPLPVFYLAEDDQGRMIVVDGLQRLGTFERFVNNRLRLQLPDREDLNGKRFADLPPKLQNRIEDCNLILYIIDHKVPEQAKLDIFERVNGGVPLTRQQMRNCLFMGEATRFLKDEAATAEFMEATGKSLKSDTMRDREFINRFCAFQLLDANEYRDMDGFLANALKKMNREPALLDELSRQFRTTLDNNLLLFGKHAFRKHQPGQTRRALLNASLWDVMSTGFSRIPTEVVKARSSAAKALFYRLLSCEDFADSITRSPNSPKQVKRRFTLARAAFAEAFDARPN